MHALAVIGGGGFLLALLIGFIILTWDALGELILMFLAAAALTVVIFYAAEAVVWGLS